MPRFLKVAMAVIVVSTVPASAHAAIRNFVATGSHVPSRPSPQGCTVCLQAPASLGSKVMLNPQPLPPRSRLNR